MLMDAANRDVKMVGQERKMTADNGEEASMTAASLEDETSLKKRRQQSNR